MKNGMVSRLFGLLLLGAIAVGPAWAEDADSTGFKQIFTQAMETMESKLNLTAEQKPQAEAIMQDALNQRLAVLSENGVQAGQRPSLSSMLAIRSKMSDIASEAQAKMEKILTPEQMQIYTAQAKESAAQIRSQLLGR